jgi:hypothetical protein
MIGAGAVLVLGTGSTATATAAGHISPHPVAGPPTLARTGTDGQIRRLAQCGGTMYAVGRFTKISQGSTVYTRDSAFSFSATAPYTVTSWAPDVNGQVNVIAFSGSNCADAYLGGSFTSVNGTAVNDIAEISTTTGNVVPGFKHNANGTVETILAAGGHLLTGGRFTSINGSTAGKYMASLNPATGSNDGFVNLKISGHYTYPGVRKNSTEVYNQQLSPDGTLDLVEGDFTSVGGLPRQQIFMLNLATDPATVTGWTSPEWDGSDPSAYPYYRCADAQPFYIQAAAWYPNGSTIYLATTGGKPWNWNGTFPFTGLCDAVAAFPATQASVTHLWIDYTDCGSLYTAAATSSTVFVAGDERWADADSCTNPAKHGGIPALGMAGYTPSGSLLLNSAGTAGQYSRSPGWAYMLITDNGLWITSGSSAGTSCDSVTVPAGICLIPYP